MDRTHLLEIDFQWRSDKRREFNAYVESVMAAQNSGFVRASTYEDRDDSNRILLVFEWTGREHLDAYLKSEGFGTLRGCLTTLGSVADCRVVARSLPDSKGGCFDLSTGRT